LNSHKRGTDFAGSALRVLDIEGRAIAGLAASLGAGFNHACELCLGCKGRVIVTGMGKSGHIGGKLAATLASTGTPSFFVHPGEASHGGLGMITPGDLVLAISHSGETSEIVMLIPILKRLGISLITFTGHCESTLARAADALVPIQVEEEACPLNLAPTASTTAALAMGDALAVALLQARGFTREDFARSHPGGSLGRRLLLTAGELMRTGDEVPRVAPDTPMSDGLLEMTQKGLGMTTVVGDDERLEGIFTDGDLRRALDTAVDIRATSMGEVTNRDCKTVSPELLAAEAVRILQEHKITSLVVVDEHRRVVGALNVHDLFRAGVM
jgi:arabinose-5-phosphate isomerase